MTTTANGISVVIPAFNASRYIAEAIDSTLAQSLDRPLEVIVVDDGSTDDTAEVLAPYDSRIRILGQKNDGVSSARNLGIERCKYNLIALLDADDRMNPGRLTAQASALETRADAVLSFTSVELIDSNGRFLERQPKIVSDVSAGDEGMTSRLFRHNFITTSSVMFKRDIVLEAGGFNPRLRYSEDFDLWLRLSLRGNFIATPSRLLI